MTSCRICSSNNVQPAFAFKNHPIVHHLKKEHSSNDSYNGSLDLYECLTCGFLFAKDYFAPATILYENYITLSGQKAQIHAQRVVDTIGYFINTTTPRIFEIGCNDGSFIKLLNAAGFYQIDAVEPAKDAYIQARTKTDNVLNEFFSVDFAEKQLAAHSYDIVVTRQVLEHIADLHDFLEGIKLILADNGLLLIEIPDHGMNYHFCDYSFWEEHVNYFSLNTLRQLLASHGFSIFYYETAIFSGQALIVYCKLNTVERPVRFCDYDLERRQNYIRAFPAFKSSFQSYLQKVKNNHEFIYVYGAGCRSLCLLDFLDSVKLITAYIDDSSDKVQSYTAGSSKPILSFEEVRPGSYYLLGLNAEVEARVIAKRNLPIGHYCSILPPSNRLPTFWQQSFCQL